jgi:hypothetical protein
VKLARTYWHAKNAANFQNGSPLVGASGIQGEFPAIPPRGPWRAGGNATEQFVGTSRISIAVSADVLTFTVTNETSMNSLGLHVLPSWSRSTFKPGGSVYQTYTWTERVGEGGIITDRYSEMNSKVR